jgi:hypothetical protein
VPEWAQYADNEGSAGVSLLDTVTNAGSRIGRYFGLVSALPAVALVVFVYLLVLSGAWTAVLVSGSCVVSIGGVAAGLEREQLRVSTAGGEQLGVGALLFEAPVV